MENVLDMQILSVQRKINLTLNMVPNLHSNECGVIQMLKKLGCLGTVFPSDASLKRKSKYELIEMLHVAEHNYQVQVEANINQYKILKTYLQDYSYEDFMKIVSKAQIERSE